MTNYFGLRVPARVFYFVFNSSWDLYCSFCLRLLWFSLRFIFRINLMYLEIKMKHLYEKNDRYNMLIMVGREVCFQDSCWSWRGGGWRLFLSSLRELGIAFWRSANYGDESPRFQKSCLTTGAPKSPWKKDSMNKNFSYDVYFSIYAPLRLIHLCKWYQPLSLSE